MYSYNDNPPVECYDCFEKDNRIQDISYWFNAALDQLYNREEFDLETLERSLDEIAGCLNMKLPSRSLAVQRSDKPCDLLEEWKSFNNEYLISLNNVGA